MMKKSTQPAILGGAPVSDCHGRSTVMAHGRQASSISVRLLRFYRAGEVDGLPREAGRGCMASNVRTTRSEDLMGYYRYGIVGQANGTLAIAMGLVKGSVS